ncbi:hypothetical protein [Acinetobacter sp. ANC 5502]
MPIHKRLSLITGLICLITLTGCQEKTTSSPSASAETSASDSAEASAMVNSSVNDLNKFTHPASEAKAAP